MKNTLSILIILFISVSLFSCTDVIEIDVKDGVSQLSVDALINNKSETQTIKLTLTQGYFDNSPIKPALGANVILFDQDSVAYQFKDLKNTGVYSYDGKANPLNKIGKQYALYINYAGEEYVSLSKLNRVPKIDSISYEVDKLPVKPENGPQEGFLPQFYAKDFDGEGDCYWIKSAKNNKYFSKATEITVAYDAGFSPGSKSDGLLFILPIRTSVGRELYSDKDTLKVDVYSTTPEQFYYLQFVSQVSQDGSLFSTPLSNIPTNIINRNEKSIKKAVGFFGMSAVSSMETIIDKSKAKPKK
ncbi:DUF4249 domain-containing protein [Emticicia sp. SJ17W-69]|uniref:DUF4249 domain-containing protein n=1 Tax=Emticicia sp. SJ17W-69 TaxID=3421657 RepID=UPI003EBDC5F3